MNDMRKLMEMVDRADDEVAYIAAKLYLGAAGTGATKPVLARKLSELANVDSPTAMLMIDAIDAYEDLREAPEEWGLAEDLRGDPAVGRVDSDDNEVERVAFLAGYQEGEQAGFNDASGRGREFGQKEETPEEAYEYWIKYDKEGLDEKVENKFGKGRQGLLTVYKLVKNGEITFGEFKNFIQAHRGIID